MANIGMKVRPVKEMEIFYGQDLVSGVKQTRTLPVDSEVSSKIWSGEVIFSQKSIAGDKYIKPLPNGDYGVANNSEWIKGTADAKAGYILSSSIAAGIPHFAVTDSDRFDVKASGKLLALVGTDTFQLGTCLYDHTAAYADGDALYVKQVDLSVAGNASVVPELAGKAGIVNVLTSVPPTTSTVTAAAVVDNSIVGYVIDGVIELKGNVAVDTGVYTLNESNQRVYTQAGMNPEGYQQTGNPLDRIVTGGPALWTEATDSNTMLKFTTKWVKGAGVTGA